MGAEDTAELLPPLQDEGLVLCPVSVRGGKRQGIEQVDLNTSDCHSEATGGRLDCQAVQDSRENKVSSVDAASCSRGPAPRSTSLHTPTSPGEYARVIRSLQPAQTR